MKKRTNRTVTVLSIMAVVALLFVGGRFFLFQQIKKSITDQMEHVGASGLTFRYTSIDVNSWKGTIHIHGIHSIIKRPDSLCHSRAFIPDIFVQGIRLLPIITRRHLVIDSILFIRPQIHYAKSDTLKTGKPSDDGGFLSGLEVKGIRIDSGAFDLISPTCVLVMSSAAHLTFGQAKVWNLNSDSLKWDLGTALARSTQINLPAEFYACRLQRLAYAKSDKSLQIDSLTMDPSLGRLEFAQKTGHQVDQISSHIPSILMSGFTIGESIHPSVKVSRVALHFTMNVYRDKRFPMAPRNRSRLPAEFMQSVPFSLTVDSLIMATSAVTYEELTETSGTPGMITFQKLAGSIHNISTDSTGETTMRITSRFMGAGNLKATFTFPLRKGLPYTVQTTLSDFPMTAANSMLVPVANLQIMSGQLQALQAQFRYDDVRANGNLDLRYTNLNVTSLSKDKDKSKNKLLTIVMNTMIQNNMDLSDQKAKRSGTIQWDRDQQASILNYWWKSILSGIRSVYSLDKILKI